jgi:hypothetical protein
MQRLRLSRAVSKLPMRHYCMHWGINLFFWNITPCRLVTSDVSRDFSPFIFSMKQSSKSRLLNLDPAICRNACNRSSSRRKLWCNGGAPHEKIRNGKGDVLLAAVVCRLEYGLQQNVVQLLLYRRLRTPKAWC